MAKLAHHSIVFIHNALTYAPLDALAFRPPRSREMKDDANGGDEKMSLRCFSGAVRASLLYPDDIS